MGKWHEKRLIGESTSPFFQLPESAEILLSQEWSDPRLSHAPPGGGGAEERGGGDADFGESRGYLNGAAHSGFVWLPTPYVRGMPAAEGVAAGDVGLKIYGNGSVEFTAR